ncbi:hypothetical protein GCM10010174_61530 [Kutzneria viridogrisea]|uniref:Small-conductance mechanosensitive channel n=1 Tax=Kutzneria viridogrisea TaxID=47990 RepID=A0ABR6BGC3_9PSEU|nr:small-conductance mechanosensitive channel [Kutzneria viridogrisea]
MAEQNEDSTAPQVPADPTEDGQGKQPEPTGTDTAPDYKAEAEKWKTLSRRHEATAKANAAAAQELASIKEQQKTAEQKLNDRLAAVQVELATYKTRETRTNAVVAAGLPPEMAEYLTEVEPDSALEQAKRLAKHLKASEPKPPADLRQGARGAQVQAADDPNAWIRRMAGRA